MDYIAKFEMTCRLRQGPSTPIQITITRPLLEDGSTATYETWLDCGAIEKPRKIRGGDSLQSLALAFYVLRCNLEVARDRGWVFCDPKTGEELDLLLNLFPPTGRNSNETD